MSRYKNMVAVMTALIQDVDNKKYVLLQKRQNTGYADNMWDFSSAGHLEANESIKKAAVRETDEELCVAVDLNALELIGIEHKCIGDNQAYVNVYFIAESYSGEPTINEPNKCSEIEWFSIEKLPKELIDDRKRILEHYIKRNNKDVYYNELNW